MQIYFEIKQCDQSGPCPFLNNCKLISNGYNTKMVLSHKSAALELDMVSATDKTSGSCFISEDIEFILSSIYHPIPSTTTLSFLVRFCVVFN